MSQTELKVRLDKAISTYQKEFENLQNTQSYYSEEIQHSVNTLGAITLKALKEFRAAILNSTD